MSGWCPCHLSSLAGAVKIRFGVFSSRWHCKVLSRIDCQLFVGHGRNEEFFHANGMAMPFVGEAEEGDDGCFFGMPPHCWQFNDWTVADGMGLLQFCTCTLLMSQQTFSLLSLKSRYLSMSLYGSYGWNNECKFQIDFIL
jgi:hypothetical protein